MHSAHDWTLHATPECIITRCRGDAWSLPHAHDIILHERQEIRSPDERIAARRRYLHTDGEKGIGPLATRPHTTHNTESGSGRTRRVAASAARDVVGRGAGRERSIVFLDLGPLLFRAELHRLGARRLHRRIKEKKARVGGHSRVRGYVIYRTSEKEDRAEGADIHALSRNQRAYLIHDVRVEVHRVVRVDRHLSGR